MIIDSSKYRKNDCLSPLFVGNLRWAFRKLPDSIKLLSCLPLITISWSGHYNWPQPEARSLGLDLIKLAVYAEMPSKDVVSQNSSWFHVCSTQMTFCWQNALEFKHTLSEYEPHCHHHKYPRIMSSPIENRYQLVFSTELMKWFNNQLHVLHILLSALILHRLKQLPQPHRMLPPHPILSLPD